MSTPVPQGFQLAGVHCGIKSEADREDLTLVVCDGPATAAGVYTQNIVHASSVDYNRQRTPTAEARVVVANSGNANACTGRQGVADTLQMAALAGRAVGARPEQALVMSTGVIGQLLPMDRVAEGIGQAVKQLGREQQHLAAAARGIMTTDRFPKVASRTVELPWGSIQLTGIAKGAGMIGPHLATMLALVMTDARLEPHEAQQALTAAVDVSFNCISVEGHMSTNDTVLLLASGAAGRALMSGDLQQFQAALNDLCIELAKMIPADGEGASHLISIEVRGCASRADAHAIARTIAGSSLVKTGIAGADPNWGRIVSAAGYAGVPFDPQQLRLTLNGTLLYEHGEPVPLDVAALSQSIRANHQTSILVELSEGDAACTFWTSDLTVDYVRLNSEYHT